MRKIYLLLLALLAVGCTQKKVIEYPVSDNVLDYLSIYQIELSDKQTVMRGNVYNRPDQWVNISSGAVLKGLQTGQEYKLLGSEEFELDRQLYMPESGTRPITLIFEALDSQDTVVDLVEYMDNSIKGIRLSPQSDAGKSHTIIRGTVVDRPYSSRMALARSAADMRGGKWVSIPVVDGKFEYDLVSDEPQAYELALWDDRNNNNNMVTFFSEPGDVNVIFYPRNAEKKYEASSTTALNNEFFVYRQEYAGMTDMSEFEKEQRKLLQGNRIYNPEMQAMMERARAVNDRQERDKIYGRISEMMTKGEGFSDEALALMAKMEQKRAEAILKELSYINKETPDITSYYVLYQRLTANTPSAMPNMQQLRGNAPGARPAQQEDMSAYVEAFNTVYAPKYPDHQYTQKIKNIMARRQAAAAEKK